MPNRYRFAPIDIDRCLLVLAYCGGNAKDAIRRLKEGAAEAKANGEKEEWNIPQEATLRSWSRQHVDRYAELQKNNAEKIEAVAIAQARDTVIRAGTMEARIIAKLEQKLDEIPAKDLPGALRNVAITRAVSIDKLMLLTDRPTVITDKRDAQSILEAIARKAPGLVISDAEEIGPAAELSTGHDE